MACVHCNPSNTRAASLYTAHETDKGDTLTTDRIGTLQLLEGGRAEIGGQSGIFQFTQSIDLASAAASTGANQDVAVTGLLVEDIVLSVTPGEALTVGVSVAALSPVAVANTLRLRVANPTVAAVDAAAINFVVVVMRP